MTRIIFRHPEPDRLRPRILPIFLPNAGCPHRCLFCDQERVTGRPGTAMASAGPVAGLGASPGMGAGAEAGMGLRQALDELPGRFAPWGPTPVEAAFYGGTFTALPGDWPLRFLQALHPFRERGLVSAVRCSTRPDAVSKDQLERLAGAGLDTVELGVQTFADDVLRAARRGHGAEASRRACALVREAGLGLGLQLLPGLPGHTPRAFAEDIAQCLALKPDFVRIHPCLVLRGTGLEDLWRQGLYAPWDMAATLETLGEAVWTLWRGGIAVARLGLAPEASMLSAVLAGPWHPALGSRVRARALWHEIRARLEGWTGPDGRAGQAGQTGRSGQPWESGQPEAVVSLCLPQRFSGEFWGHAGEMEPGYRALGLSRGSVHFTQGEDMVLEIADTRETLETPETGHA